MAPIVEESVEYYASSMGDDAARNLFWYPSINLGIFQGGDAINTVPQSARAEVDVRLTAGVHTPDVLVDNAVVYAQLPARWQSQFDQ